MVDANGLVTQLEYDPRWRLIRQDVAGVVTQYRYDKAGQLTQVITPDQRTLSYLYDLARRLISQRDATSNRIDYRYDAMSNRTETQIIDQQGQLRHAQHQLSRLKQSLGAEGQTVTVNYDASGLVTDTTDALSRFNRILDQIVYLKL